MPRDPHEIDEATLRLLIAPGLGPATLRRLRRRLGSDAAIVAATPRRLREEAGVSPTSAAAIRHALKSTDPDRERSAMRDGEAQLILRGAPDYPALLATIPAAPEALWVRGRLDPADVAALAVVGSRRATTYGREQASRFAGLLAASGLSIVSGGARGIDAAAHRAALRAGGRTIAVLGCGLAVCYPPEHRRLYDEIASSGALISEHPMEMPPLARNFPRRNRVISGLSLGVLVVEAAARSGALITARLAAEEHGREVMALPGPVDSAASRGVLALIRDGGAGLVIDHRDVLSQLEGCGGSVRSVLAAASRRRPPGADDPGANAAQASTGSLLASSLPRASRAILRVLRGHRGGLDIGTIVRRADLPARDVMAALTGLEIGGWVDRAEGGTIVASRSVGLAELDQQDDETDQDDGANDVEGPMHGGEDSREADEGTKGLRD
ncbi:MAG: DNA-protecting protein DprA [Planctomycetes bacterium]|nr:DNA-protecting protein DprA [Planctomycetota bacterium]